MAQFNIHEKNPSIDHADSNSLNTFRSLLS